MKYILMLILGLLLATSVNPSHAQPTLNLDLWVSTLKVYLDGSYRVSWVKQGPDLVPGGVMGGIYVNDTLLDSFVVGGAAVGSDTGTVSINPGDTLLVLVDKDGLVTEINEDNNWMDYVFPDTAVGLSATYPPYLYPDISGIGFLKLVDVDYGQQTGYWPYALLIVPPFNRHESVQKDPTGTMETALEIVTYNGSETETAWGVTASLAIESGVEIFDIGASVGVEIQKEMEERLGRSVQQTRSETFEASMVASDPNINQAEVVLCQTAYDVCKYQVYNPHSDGFMWIAVPVEPERGSQNPKLISMKLSDYEATGEFTYKPENAPDLEQAHDAGFADQYPDHVLPYYMLHCLDHVPDATHFYKDLGWVKPEKVFSGNEVFSGGAKWSETILEENSYSQTATVGYNMYAKGELSGSSATVSYGSSESRSHRIWEGTETIFSWEIGPVPNEYNYEVIAFAENLVFDHGEGDNAREKDALVLMCFYLVRASDGMPGQAWHRNLKAMRDWEAIEAAWPGKSIGSMLADCEYAIDQPVVNDAPSYYRHLEAFTASCQSWADQFTASDVPKLQDFIGANAELDTALQWIFLNDSTSYTYMPLVHGLMDDVNETALRVFESDPSRIYPYPCNGQNVNIDYNAVGTVLDTSLAVSLRLGNDGGAKTDYPMTFDPDRGIWEVVVPVPAGAVEIDYEFSDGFSTDDRNGLGWHVATSADWRTHDNGNVALSLTSLGTIGYTDETRTEGVGLVYGGQDRLYIGDFWVGEAAGPIGLGPGWVANGNYDNNDDPDWLRARRDPRGIWLSASAGSQLSSAVFTDTIRGITVYQGGASRSDPADDDFVIVSYRVHNDGPSGRLLYAGQFADFDVTSSGASDEGGTDASRRLAYVYGGGSDPYVGVCLLDTLPLTSQHGLSLTATLIKKSLHPSHIADSEKYQYLSGGLGTPISDGPSNWCALVSIGPFWLAPGEGVDLNYAVVAGSNLAELQANVDRAQEWWSHPGIPAPTGIGDRGRIAPSPVLYQNFPNPFNADTRIAFYLPQTSEAKLEIFDVAGRRIRTVHNGPLARGEWRFNWDGRNEAGNEVSTGVYFCRLSTESVTRVNKMVLLK